MLRHQTPVIPTPVLKLKGEMTIFQAAELKALLLSDPLPQMIDLSAVTEIDSAGIQLLILAKKIAIANHSDFHLVAVSSVVTDVFKLMRLRDFFEVLTRWCSHES